MGLHCSPMSHKKNAWLIWVKLLKFFHVKFYETGDPSKFITRMVESIMLLPDLINCHSQVSDQRHEDSLVLFD